MKPLILLAAAVLALTTLTTDPSAGAAPGPAPAATVAPPNPVLVAVLATHHSPAGRAAFDRVAFRFRGGSPSSVHVRYVKRLLSEGAARPVRIAGRAILRVRFFPADAHSVNGRPTAPARRAFSLPDVMTAVRAGDFEAVTTYGLGLARRTPFRVVRLNHPTRIAVDVRAAFRTVSRRVFFLDRAAFEAGREPFVHSVRRPVLPGSAPRAVLDRLFAGPTRTEQAAGLRLLRSGATGLRHLRIRDGVARVRMTGGCDSHGSTVTLADEVMPTLKQFRSVRHVKIYGPAGRTERPRGHIDSIPGCLEP